MSLKTTKEGSGCEYLDTRSVSLALGPWNLGSHLHPPYRAHDTAGADVPWVGIWSHLTGPQGQVGSAFQGRVKAWWTRVGRGHSGPAAAGVAPAGGVQVLSEHEA